MPRSTKHMEAIQLKEFVRTGFFGKIGIGSTKDDLLKYLGSPEATFGNDDETETLKYGWYEFAYRIASGKVFGIQNDHLQADCVNHHEMISFKNKFWKLGKWFLKENRNATLRQVSDLLKSENIPFEVQPSQEQASVKCIQSKVILHFVSEFRLVETDDKGRFKRWLEMKENEVENFVLHAISLYDLTR